MNDNEIFDAYAQAALTGGLAADHDDSLGADEAARWAMACAEACMSARVEHLQTGRADETYALERIRKAKDRVARLVISDLASAEHALLELATEIDAAIEQHERDSR